MTGKKSAVRIRLIEDLNTCHLGGYYSYYCNADGFECVCWH